MSVKIDAVNTFGIITNLSELIGTSEPALRLLLSILSGKYRIIIIWRNNLLMVNLFFRIPFGVNTPKFPLWKKC